MAPSYAHGTSTAPLLGDTIGEVFRRTVEAFPDREALVVRSQGYRATYRGETGLGLLSGRPTEVNGPDPDPTSSGIRTCWGFAPESLFPPNPPQFVGSRSNLEAADSVQRLAAGSAPAAGGTGLLGVGNDD